MIHIRKHKVENRLPQIRRLVVVPFQPMQQQKAMQKDHVKTSIGGIRDPANGVETGLAGLFHQGYVNFPGGGVKTFSAKPFQYFHEPAPLAVGTIKGNPGVFDNPRLQVQFSPIVLIDRSLAGPFLFPAGRKVFSCNRSHLINV
ncbi:MAG: hypothetical protein V3U48_05060 [Rhodospirillales bacterium]